MALVCVSLAWIVAGDAVYDDRCFVVLEDTDGSSEEDLGSGGVVREIYVSRNPENAC